MVDRLREEYREALEIEWRAFELRPEPVPTLPPDGEYLERVWSSSVYPMARDRGMKMVKPPVQPRTRLAHQAAELARERGCFDAYRTALFKAFFEHGQNIGRPEVLAELGAEAGLEAGEVTAALERETYLDRVLEQEYQARLLAIAGVPAMLLGSDPKTGLRVTGAHPYEAVRGAVEQALEKRGA